jgi:hypothetical protein
MKLRESKKAFVREEREEREKRELFKEEQERTKT